MSINQLISHSIKRIKTPKYRAYKILIFIHNYNYRFLYKIKHSPQILVLPPLNDVRSPINRMALLGGGIILLINLDSLISLGGDHPGAGHVEGDAEYSSLAVHGARLNGCLESLEVVASSPVPEVHCTIISSGDEHSVLVDSQTVNDGVVS